MANSSRQLQFWGKRPTDTFDLFFEEHDQLIGCAHDYWVHINSSAAVFFFCLITPPGPGHYGNTADRCQDVRSLGVGVQLRPPPVFIHRRPPFPPPSFRLAVFLNRQSSDSPLRFQNRPWTGGGRQWTLKGLFKQVWKAQWATAEWRRFTRATEYVCGEWI